MAHVNWCLLAPTKHLLPTNQLALWYQQGNPAKVSLQHTSSITFPKQMQRSEYFTLQNSTFPKIYSKGVNNHSETVNFIQNEWNVTL